MKKVIPKLIFLLLPIVAGAQSLESFIGRVDPTSLNYLYSQNNDCPWYEAEAKRAIERAITSNNVKPENTLGTFYLNTTAICLQVRQLDMLTVMFNVNFGAEALLFVKNYGSLASGPLLGDFTYRLDNLESMIGSAIADYLLVNSPGELN